MGCRQTVLLHQMTECAFFFPACVLLFVKGLLGLFARLDSLLTGIISCTSCLYFAGLKQKSYLTQAFLLGFPRPDQA